MAGVDGGDVLCGLRGAAHEENFGDDCFGTRYPFYHLFHFCHVDVFDKFGVAPTLGSVWAGMQAGGVFDSCKAMGQELCGAIFRGWEFVDGWKRADVMDWHQALISIFGDVRQSERLRDWLGGPVGSNISELAISNGSS